MSIDRGKFFSSVRKDVFHGHLNQKQVDGLGFILDEWEKESFTDLRFLAYMLGTAFHETAETMQPVHEYGGNSYFTRLYGVEGQNPSRARRMGNTEIGDGIKYCGRGYVQLTWKNNYKRMGDLIGADLVSFPDMAMRPIIAAKIMFIGMTSESKNTFSGVNLQHYFNESNDDWEGARHVINGTDHASLIAETSLKFYSALGENNGR
jgi:hypothetical protein